MLSDPHIIEALKLFYQLSRLAAAMLAFDLILEGVLSEINPKRLPKMENRIKVYIGLWCLTFYCMT